MNVWVGPLAGDGAKPVTDDRERGAPRLLWARDNRHLVYPQDTGGDENWHVHVVDLGVGTDAT